VSDIDTAPADSLKALDPKRPIREAEVTLQPVMGVFPRRPSGLLVGSAAATDPKINRLQHQHRFFINSNMDSKHHF
jgi:hypothetical protein